jgi:16S rRNA (uracil1498-N3)-methyltransferase
MNLFYAKPDKIQGNIIVIDGQEAIHISKVLRHSEGDQILVTDGKGHEYECRIREVKKKSVYLGILNTQSHSKPEPQIVLCMGIIKKRDRLEFAVEKAVELGVGKIVLFEGEHSQKGNVREDRLESTAISAMKQSLRFYLPEVVIEKNISEAISRHAHNSTLIFADETVEQSDQEKKVLSEEYFLIVGPEGGFSSNERAIVNKNNPKYYSLGKHRLRTETAAVVMVDRFVSFK